MNKKQINDEMNIKKLKEVFGAIPFYQSFLSECSETYDYFWNGFFAAVFYLQDKKGVNDLYADTDIALSQIYRYLRCESKLEFIEFLRLSESLNIDINNPDFHTDAYISMAINYITDQKYYFQKGTRRKEYEKFFHEIKDSFREEYVFDLEEKQDNLIEEELSSFLVKYSDEQLSYLYQILDILSELYMCDITFLQLYSQLNLSGRTLFKEALELYSKTCLGVEDDSIVALKKYSTITKENKINSISSKALIDQLGRKGWFSLENVQILSLFLYMDENTWDTLILFHKFAENSDEENLPDLPYDIILSLLTFLDWLSKLPSMRLKE